jgi:protein arginine N-methyltransferase 5
VLNSTASPSPVVAPAAGSPSSTSSTPRLMSETSSEMISTAPEGELNGTWEMWDLIRTICDYDTRLTLSEP